MPFNKKDDLLKRIYEQNESVSKINLEDLEIEHRIVLEKMIDSQEDYNKLYGYYFSLVVELYSRYVLEDAKNGNKSNFNRATEYRESLQKRIEEE
jgi:hypothetical protein